MRSLIGRILSLFFLLLVAGIIQAEPLTLYLSPDGDDTHTGQSSQALSSDGPLRTITGAENEIQTLKAKGALPREGVIVEIAPGRYPMDKPAVFYDQNSGTAEGPIIYRSQELGKAIFTGDVELTKLDPVTNATALGLLRPEARDHVRQIDLSSYFPGDMPGFAGGGIYFTPQPDHPIEIFQDDQAMPQAQWPKEGYLQTGECLGASVGTGILKNYPDGKFRSDSDRLVEWAREPDLWFHGMDIDVRLKVGGIDASGKTIQIANPKDYQPGFTAGQNLVMFNAIGEISRPGEWAVDRSAKLLYIWPRQDPSQAPLHLSVTPELIHAHQVSHLRFEGFVFEGARDTALQFDHCSDITFQGCTMRHIEGFVLRSTDDKKVSVIGCDLYDLGEGGVSLGGGDRATLTPSQDLVENCHIYDYGRFVEDYQAAVEIRYNSVGSTVRHNLIHDGPHNAILFDGNDHLIEYNIIHDVTRHSDDVGAIYTCTRDWSKRGTIIRYNIIHYLRPLSNTKDARRPVYLDDYTSGTQVYSNVLTTASAGVQIGGGKDNSITNNLILLCPTAIEYSSRGMDSFDAKDARLGRQSVIFQATLASPYNTPLWRQHYPKIAPELEGDPVKAHDAVGNVITNNIFACTGIIQIDNAKEAMKTSEVDHNAFIDGDPGLVDPAKLDFTLKKDGPGMKALPTFVPLPLEKMGLYPDPKRASPAVRFGPHVTPLPPLLSRLEKSRTWQQAPVASVAKGKITVDGVEAPGEWDTALESAIVCAANSGGSDASSSAKAWAASDGTALFLLVVVNRDSALPFVGKGKWGERDGFEIVVRNSHDPHAPVGHLRCYPDGTFESVAVGWQDGPWAAKIGPQISYAAKIESTRWTAELRLPFDTFDIEPTDKIFFNLNVRRMSDQSWTAWIKTPNGFAESGESGVLNLSTTAKN